jgi:hypothetical protein
MIIVYDYPFSLAEHVGSITSGNNLQTKSKVVSTNIMKADYLTIFLIRKEKLCEGFG